MAAGASSASAAASSFRIDVRFMKSSTPRPDEKRALRAVEQHVIGPGHVVADHLRRMPPEEQSAGIADTGGERVRDRRSRSRDALPRAGRPEAGASSSDRTTITAPKSRQLAPAMSAFRNCCTCRSTAASTASAKATSSVSGMDCAAVSCSAWASRSAAIHRGSLSLSAITSDFRRPGDAVDADRAEYHAAGCGHVGVAGPHDLGHRLDGLGAVGERGDTLRPPTRVDLVDAGQLRRCQHERVELAARRRHHDRRTAARPRLWPAPRS